MTHVRKVSHVNSTNDACEYGGYLTKCARESNKNVIPATRKIYMPLLKMPPADPTTVLTCIKNIMSLLEIKSDDFLIMVADQQIYAILCTVKWNYPELCSNLLPNLGGFPWKMNVIGCTGYFMDGNGLDIWMKKVFSSVDKMLSGKLHPLNFRALRLCIEVLLEDTIEICNSEDELIAALEARSQQSVTTKMFTECLIKPILLYIDNIYSGSVIKIT